jgi:hypothetical protein
MCVVCHDDELCGPGDGVASRGASEASTARRSGRGDQRPLRPQVRRGRVDQVLRHHRPRLRACCPSSSRHGSRKVRAPPAPSKRVHTLAQQKMLSRLTRGCFVVRKVRGRGGDGADGVPAGPEQPGGRERAPAGQGGGGSAAPRQRPLQGGQVRRGVRRVRRGPGEGGRQRRAALQPRRLPRQARAVREGRRGLQRRARRAPGVLQGAAQEGRLQRQGARMHHHNVKVR